MGFDIARAARGALGPLGEHATPALERVEPVGGADLEVRPAVAQGDDRLLGAHDGRAAIGDDLGETAPRDHPRPAGAVAADAAFDPVLAGLLNIDRGVGGDDARELVAERFVGDREEQLAALEPQDGHALLPVAGEGEALQDEAGVGVQEEAIAVGERQLESRARVDPHHVAGEQRLVRLERARRCPVRQRQPSPSPRGCAGTSSWRVHR